MLNEKNEKSFPPITVLPIFADAIAGAIDASKEQLANMQKAKDKPYVLDDELINRVIKSYTEQNKSIANEKMICCHWRQEKLTEQQTKSLDAIELNLIEMEKINQQILFLAEHYKNHTIDKILNMEENELALAYLSGQLYSSQIDEQPSSEGKNRYPKDMLPMVDYEKIEEDFFSGSLVDLEYNTMQNLCCFVDRLTEIMRKKMIQVPELMVAHLCAYLGFLTAAVLSKQESTILQPHILNLIKTHAMQSYKQFTTYVGNATTKEKKEKRLTELCENSPGSIVAQTLRLNRVIWDSLETLYNNRPLNLVISNQKQSELFCPQDLFIELLKETITEMMQEQENRIPVLFIINQTALQIGWLIGYYGYYDKEPPNRYLEYGLPCVELYLESGIELLRK